MNVTMIKTDRKKNERRKRGKKEGGVFDLVDPFSFFFLTSANSCSKSNKHAPLALCFHLNTSLSGFSTEFITLMPKDSCQNPDS